MKRRHSKIYRPEKGKLQRKEHRWNCPKADKKRDIDGLLRRQTKIRNKRQDPHQISINPRHVSQKVHLLNNTEDLMHCRDEIRCFQKYSIPLALELKRIHPSTVTDLTTVSYCFLNFTCWVLSSKPLLISVVLHLPWRCYQLDHGRNPVFQALRTEKVPPPALQAWQLSYFTIYTGSDALSLTSCHWDLSSYVLEKCVAIFEAGENNVFRDIRTERGYCQRRSDSKRSAQYVTRKTRWVLSSGILGRTTRLFDQKHVFDYAFQNLWLFETWKVEFELLVGWSWCRICRKLGLAQQGYAAVVTTSRTQM